MAAGRGDARRTALLDAAVRVLAEGGAQALSHRSVEAAAGAAHGSTRYYFATRDKLVEAVLAHLAAEDHAALDDAPPVPISAEAAVQGALVILDRALTTDRARTIARYELFLEAARRPELQPALHRWGETFWSQAEPVVAALGSTAPVTDARTLVELVDGLIFGQLARPRPDFPNAASRALRAFLTGLS